ncbi:MAG: hypothetical protein RL757_354 [Bacteroidota bacterium]|jgi:DNA-binding LytR/AlgR family response regulator
MSQEELNQLLNAHAEWWTSQGENGDNLTLNDVDLSRLDFKNSNLKGANLSRCNAQYCNFEWVNMTSINVTNTDFRGANFAHANMTKIDFRYVRIDETTCFDHALAKGMLVDWATFNQLPPSIQAQKPIVVNPNVVEMVFEIKSETKDVVVQALSDMGDYLEAQNEAIRISSTKEGNQYRFKVEADSQDKVIKITQDIQFFGDILAGRQRLDSEKEQALLESRYRRLQKNYEELEADRKEIKMLYAETRVELKEAKEALKAEYNTKQQFMDIIENMSSTMRQVHALPVAKDKDTRYTFSTPEKKDLRLEIEEIICCITIPETKTAELYLKNNEVVVIVFKRFEDLAQELAELSSDLFKCSKNLIINLNEVESTESLPSNRVKVLLRNQSQTKINFEIVVARDYKPKFETLMKEKT